MKISFSFKQPELRQEVEGELELYVGKLEKLLQRYSPDLVQIHGSFDRRPRRASCVLSLNLSLPTGTLHSTGEDTEIRSCVRRAFIELESQLKKHQAKLRKDYEWKRKRERRAPLVTDQGPSG